MEQVRNDYIDRIRGFINKAKTDKQFAQQLIKDHCSCDNQSKLYSLAGALVDVNERKLAEEVRSIAEQVYLNCKLNEVAKKLMIA